MMYNGPVDVYFDASTGKKALAFALALDIDGQAYVALHSSKGEPFLRNAKYGRDGAWNRGKQDADERSYVYLDRRSLIALRDQINQLLGMPNAAANGLPEHLPGTTYVDVPEEVIEPYVKTRKEDVVDLLQEFE